MCRRDRYRDKLKEALVQDGDTMNFTVFKGKNSNPGEIIDLAETMPFLAAVSYTHLARQTGQHV